MRAVVTRVTEASVVIEGKTVGSIQKGFLVLLGVAPEDTEAEAIRLADKVCGCRVFEDENGKMNLNLETAGGDLLIISQFTLYADCKHGNRPGFTDAMEFNKASEYYDLFVKMLRDMDFHVEVGIFGADMKIELLNDGPVTILLDTDDL